MQKWSGLEMTNTAFLEQLGGKPFHLSDFVSFLIGEYPFWSDKEIKFEAKGDISQWQAEGIIARCKPPKGQHHAKKYYKAVQP